MLLLIVFHVNVPECLSLMKPGSDPATRGILLSDPHMQLSLRRVLKQRPLAQECPWQTVVFFPVCTTECQGKAPRELQDRWMTDVVEDRHPNWWSCIWSYTWCQTAESYGVLHKLCWVRQMPDSVRGWLCIVPLCVLSWWRSNLVRRV